MALYKLLTLIIISLGTVIALIQIGIAVRTFRADHERRRKQATIEYINALRENYRRSNNALINKFGNDPIGKKEAKEIIDDEEYWALLKDMLGQFEHLSVGVNTNVFDIEILNKMSGQYLINVFDRWKKYIELRREVSTLKKVYIDFEILVNRLNSMRRNRDDKDKIKYS